MHRDQIKFILGILGWFSTPKSVNVNRINDRTTYMIILTDTEKAFDKHQTLHNKIREELFQSVKGTCEKHSWHLTQWWKTEHFPLM